MNAKQLAAIAKRITEAAEYGVVIDEWRPFYPWHTDFAEETRPGRGRDVSAIWSDGEHLAQIMVDPYGNGTFSLAETTWLHSSGDEECPCAPCATYRESES